MHIFQIWSHSILLYVAMLNKFLIFASVNQSVYVVGCWPIYVSGLSVIVTYIVS